MEEELFTKPALDKFRQWHFWWLVVIVAMFMGFFLGVVEIGLSQNNGEPQNNIDFPQIKGQASGMKAVFEITDSDYLNITLKSSIPIEAAIQSAPKVVSVVIQPNPVSPVQLTFSGFALNKTYYRYDNSFKNEIIFNTDSTGNFSFVQDLSQGHHIWVQETRGTLFIPADCSGSVGIFNQTTNTCTLNQDLSTNIEIINNGITLDCNNHKLSDGFRWTSFAILLNNRQNVTIKNCIIKNATNAVNVAFSNINTFVNNNVSGNETGFRILSSDNNTISNNKTSANTQGVALGSFSDSNNVTDNNISDLLFGVTIGDKANSNKIESNTITGHSSTGVHITGLANANILSENVITQNAFGVFVLQSDGTALIDNTIHDNQNGITIGVQSFDTKVFHNNFINNTTQAQAFTASSFDNGLLDGGNYWNSYDTPAEGCHNLNNDNFCDAPFIFIGGQDNFPWTRQDGWRGPPKMIKPESMGRILKRFPSYPGHEGIDLLDSDKVFGASVKAAASGVVEVVKRTPTLSSAAGKWVWISHGDIRKLDGTIASKISTRYLHLNTIEASLVNGQNVLVGTEIGTVGSTGTNIPHLHFEVRQGDIPLDKDFSKTNFLNPEEFVDYPLPPETLSIQALSPVDLVVTDPSGLVISKTINELLPSASYFDIEYLEDLSEGENILNYDLVVIDKRKFGDYLITVVPEQGATATDTYSINIESANKIESLVENILVSDIPAQPYIIRSAEAEIEKIIPVTIRIESETLNLSQHGIFTVSLQVSKGFGITVEDINTNIIVLSGASPKKINFNKGTNTLNIKFNTRDLVGVSPGNQVTLTIAGRLLNGTTFEGSDTIRVIKKGNIFSVFTNVFYTLIDMVTSLFAAISSIYQ